MEAMDYACCYLCYGIGTAFFAAAAWQVADVFRRFGYDRRTRDDS